MKKQFKLVLVRGWGQGSKLSIENNTLLLPMSFVCIEKTVWKGNEEKKNTESARVSLSYLE